MREFDDNSGRRSHQDERTEKEVDSEGSNNRSGEAPKPQTSLLESTIFQHTLYESCGSTRHKDGQAVAEGEKKNVGHSGQHLLLKGNQGEDRGDEPERAGTRKDPIGEAESQGTPETPESQSAEKPSTHRAGAHPHHVQGNPDEDHSHQNGPVGSHLTEHSSQHGADCTHKTDAGEEPRREENSITSSLTGSEARLLPGNVAHDKRNGGQVAGAEEHADDAPQKGADGSQA